MSKTMLVLLVVATLWLLSPDTSGVNLDVSQDGIGICTPKPKSTRAEALEQT